MSRLATTTTRLFSAWQQHAQPLRLASSRRPAMRYAPMLVRAMSAEGQITSELIDSMRGKIQTALDAQRVEVTDMQGDGRHVEIVVVAKAFEGQSAVNRQRMVYKAIWQELSETVHAVDAMVTKTPEEVGM